MAKTILYMIRHGRAGGNRAHILNGCRLNPPLTKLGFLQAKKLAHEWKTKPDVILSSPLRRAMSTARVLARKYRMKIVKVPLLVEQDCGKWTGKNFMRLMETHPQRFFRLDGKTITYMKTVPGGEGERDMARRAEKWLAWVKKKYEGKTIVAFSHGVFMHACISVYEKIPAPEIYRKRIPNTHFRKLEI